MSLRGDLTTLDLADLLQNLETRGTSGVLAIDGPSGRHRIYLRKGRISLLATDERPGLMEVLVASGTLSPSEVDDARRARRGTRRSLGEALVEGGAIAAESLHALAEARLLDEACELVAAKHRSFHFEESGVPRGMFDPEERRLELGLASGALLMESARRQDHWRLIRRQLPSDAAHLVLTAEPEGLAEGRADAQLVVALAPRLDGTRSITEVLAAFPHSRFEAYRSLAGLFETRAVREAAPEEMAQLANELAAEDPERSWRLVERALASSPRSVELIEAKARLAEALGRTVDASEALEIAAHRHLEHGNALDARRALSRAKELDPDDPAPWEQSLKLALSEGRDEDARSDARRLGRLYASAGLHRRSRDVWRSVVELDGTRIEPRIELARAEAAAGEPALATEALSDLAVRLVRDERDDDAASVLRAVLEIEPDHAEARESLREIEEGESARRRERRRGLMRRTAAVALAIALLGFLGNEGVARVGLARAEARIGAERWIEAGRYAEAAELLEELRERHPFTTTAAYDLPRRIDSLRRRDVPTD